MKCELILGDGTNPLVVNHGQTFEVVDQVHISVRVSESVGQPILEFGSVPQTLEFKLGKYISPVSQPFRERSGDVYCKIWDSARPSQQPLEFKMSIYSKKLKSDELDTWLSSISTYFDKAVETLSKQPLITRSWASQNHADDSNRGLLRLIDEVINQCRHWCISDRLYKRRSKTSSVRMTPRNRPLDIRYFYKNASIWEKKNRHSMLIGTKILDFEPVKFGYFEFNSSVNNEINSFLLYKLEKIIGFLEVSINKLNPELLSFELHQRSFQFRIEILRYYVLLLRQMGVENFKGGSNVSLNHFGKLGVLLNRFQKYGHFFEKGVLDDVELPRLSTLYELVCISSCIGYLESLNFVIRSRANTSRSISFDYFRLVRGKTSVEIFYEAYVEFAPGVEPAHGLSLIVDRPAIKPDIIIKVSDGQSNQTVIIDAKFKRRQSARNQNLNFRNDKDMNSSWMDNIFIKYSTLVRKKLDGANVDGVAMISIDPNPTATSLNAIFTRDFILDLGADFTVQDHSSVWRHLFDRLRL